LPRKIEHKWFRTWALEALGNPDPDGFNAYKEFGPQEHWCWYALRCLCASTDMQPVICVTPYVGYTDQQFAELFKVDIRVWEVVKRKLDLAGRIEVDSQNVIRITAWERYAGRYFQQKKNRDMELRLWSEEDEQRERLKKKEKAEIFKRVILYLNQVAHKNFKAGSPSAFKFFSARFDEGATEENFRHVIEVKCAQWLGRQDMEMYIRPQTLFNSDKFWGYVNEPAIRRARPIGGLGSVSILPEERTKYEPEAKVEYEARLRKAMNEYGWKSTEEIPADAYLKGIPTFEEFFSKIFMPKKRTSPDWSLE